MFGFGQPFYNTQKQTREHCFDLGSNEAQMLPAQQKAKRMHKQHTNHFSPFLK
jgi:hypothetical protein